MAIKPVFTPGIKPPFFSRHDIEITYNMGLSVSQKRKNIKSVHESFQHLHPGLEVLEISSKSEDETGAWLSAFNLQKHLPSLGKSFSVECIYQAGKVFENGGPYRELLYAGSKEAKKDERLKDSGEIIAFEYEGKTFPATPQWAFYNYLYMSALKEKPALSEYVLKFRAFSDIEFSVDGINCQAAAAAQYAGLTQQNLIDDALSDFEAFLKITTANAEG